MKKNPYTDLTPFAKSEFIAKLLHCIQNNATLYESAQEIVLLGYEWDLFKGVKIGLEVMAIENQEL